MQADISTLFESDYYRILDFKCRCTDCATSRPEYNKAFSISFVRKGNFLFNVFRQSLDSYNGCILVTKPGYERTVTHTHAIPDECSIFEFTGEFYKSLLEQYPKCRVLHDNDIHSTLVKASPDAELLHYQVGRMLVSGNVSRLAIDHLVMDIVQQVMENIGTYRPDKKVNDRLKKYHLTTIEKAKEYLTANYTEDISLMELASHCLVSPFHFSRIFKAFTAYSPYQFLVSIRIKHAELLLKTTQLPVSDIAFTSGFNSTEHFTATFTGRYSCSPARYRSLYHHGNQKQDS